MKPSGGTPDSDKQKPPDVGRYLIEVAALKLVGAIRDDGENWVLTRKGMYYWVLMMREFFIAVSNFRDLMRLGIKSELDPEDLEELSASAKQLAKAGR